MNKFIIIIFIIFSFANSVLLAQDPYLMTKEQLVKAYMSHSYPFYPNKESSGAVDLRSTKDDICTSGYTKTVRNVSAKTKKSVFTAYGIYDNFGNFEIDHIISLELGGSNEKKNLFPQPYYIYPGAREKDVVENYFKKQICKGKITMLVAQKEIVNNWIAWYLKIENISEKELINSIDNNLKETE